MRVHPWSAMRGRENGVMFDRIFAVEHSLAI